MRPFVILTVAMLGGCTALKTPEEQAWLALHAVDMAQTYDLGPDPCYEEKYPPTKAMIGSNPSHAEVIGWGLVSAAAHVAVSDYLLRTERTKLAKVWQYITFGEKAFHVGRNHYLGIRVGGNNKAFAGCDEERARVGYK